MEYRNQNPSQRMHEALPFLADYLPAQQSWSVIEICGHTSLNVGYMCLLHCDV